MFDRKSLIKLIVPLMIDQFLQAFVGLADSIMVARVGEAAVSGVSLVDTVMLLIINIFTALATGGAVIAGQYIGRNRKTAAGPRRSSSTLRFFFPYASCSSAISAAT